MVKQRAHRPSKATARTYTVYVIELDRACLREPSARAPLYVGQTAHRPEHRFAQHKKGGKLAASKPHKFGLRLRYDLMVGIRRFTTRKEAERAEAVVREGVGEPWTPGILGLSKRRSCLFIPAVRHLIFRGGGTSVHYRALRSTRRRFLPAALC